MSAETGRQQEAVALSRRVADDFRAAQASGANLGATLRTALRVSGDMIPLSWNRRRCRQQPLVVLCDISGSMGRYSRMLLHFLHAMTSDHDQVYRSLFGTRLTNITCSLRHQHIDVALNEVAATVSAWSDGTRIGACLDRVSFDWPRGILGQGAVALLVTDGLVHLWERP